MIQQLAKSVFVATDDEALQPAGDKNQSLQGTKNLFAPSQHSRPMAGALIELFLVRKIVPMDAGAGVVFKVVAVVEKQDVVKSTIVAGGAAGVLVFALEPAEAEAEQVAGDVGGEKEFWGERGDGGPE